MTLLYECCTTLNRYANQADNTDFLSRKGIINLQKVSFLELSK